MNHLSPTDFRQSPRGYFSFVLHSHIPYVLGHGRWPFGTDWLSEACAETYLPLLNTLNQLIDEGNKPHLAIGLTPVLCEQLAQADFKNEFNSYLLQKIETARADIKEFTKRGETQYRDLANNWLNFYQKIHEDFNHRYQKDLISVFKKLQDAGYIEIITSAATHGYLPLLKEESSIQGQIKTGIEIYRQHFGQAPKGFWLPECAYRPRYFWQPPDYPGPAYERPGIDEFLADEPIEYFIIDSHLLGGGKAIGGYLSRFAPLKKLWEQLEKEFVPGQKLDFKPNPYEPYLVGSNPKKKPVAFFTRDPRTALQVWSGEWGYPGDGWYLDFHKKRFPGGLRYWRVTNPKLDLGLKEIYDPTRIEERTKSHAQHFLSLVNTALTEYYEKEKKPGFLCIPYDAELFGHWWFEGPQWLYNVFKSLLREGKFLFQPILPSAYLEKNYPNRVVALPEGSWGEGGFHYLWLNEDTKWTWQIIYRAEEEFKQLLVQSTSNTERVMKQLARELLLLQSSDWQFLISTGHARTYAWQRFSEHSEKFQKLLILTKKILNRETLTIEENNYLADCEKADAIFPNLDLNWFKPSAAK